jgi:hypothetical protein
VAALRASGASGPAINVNLEIVSTGSTGIYAFVDVLVDENETITSVTPNSRITFIKREEISSLDLYAEAEGEDERLRLVLDNFGRKVDEENEYIFRDSSIDEEGIDYRLLNRKRKELLLEGDKIYSYMGSYKSFVSVLDFFGYEDIRIKEYFLNVDTSSPDMGKLVSFPVATDDTQKEAVRRAWKLIPSQILKKTSMFGLYYDINRLSGEIDDENLPEVEDSFQFTIEEILIKLFGLKELLRKEFLPLNARIYDITGEGIYFEIVKLNTWSDHLNLITLELGKRPEFTVFPSDYGYIVDLRRIDAFYRDRFFREQGLTGYLGSTASTPSMTSGTLTLRDYVGSYDDYLSEDTISPDPLWVHFPPSIADPLFNLNTSYEKPLSDDLGIPIGAPVLLEANFELTWLEGDFTWEHASILDVSLDPVNINMWTWDTIGRGQFLDMRWVIEKGGIDAFRHDTGRMPISHFEYDYTDEDGNESKRVLHTLALPFVGDYTIALYLYDATNQFSVEFENYTVKPSEADFTMAVQKFDICKTWEATDFTWKNVQSPWTYPTVVTESTWEESTLAWTDLQEESFRSQSLYELTVPTYISQIDRSGEWIKLSGNVLGYPGVTSGDFLFFDRQISYPTYSDWEIPLDGLTGTTASGIGTLYYDPSSTGLTVMPYTQIMIKGSTGNDYSAMDYIYADVISVNDLTNTLTFSAEETYIQEFRAKNATGASGIKLYMDWGYLAGTYAIPIKTVGLSGSDTLFYLNDVQKELFSIDSNFNVKFALYDVDYAEQRIGKQSLLYENINETSWDEISHQNWYSLQYEAGANPGFVIPFVAPGGSIRIDEGDLFTFSGASSISSTRNGLTASILELSRSDNESIRSYDYRVLPSDGLTAQGVTASAILGSTASAGATVIYLNYVPQNIRVTAEVIASLQPGGTLSFSLKSGGCGYALPPNFHVPGPVVGSTASISCVMNEGAVSSITFTGGTGYTAAPIITVDKPIGFEEDLSDWAWIGEWVHITSVVGGSAMYLENAIASTVNKSTDVLLPYRYHKQLYLNPDRFQQFYWFIHAASNDPSSSRLSYLTFDDGVEGEWAAHPERSYTYPLSNALLFDAEGEDLHFDRSFKTWEYYGEDYPGVQNVEKLFLTPDDSPDQARGPYALSSQGPFRYVDTVVTDRKIEIDKFSLVMFSPTKCRVPSKQSHRWTIYDDDDNSEVVVSSSKNMVWNFTRPGSYSVKLDVSDSNGNISSKKHVGKVTVK